MNRVFRSFVFAISFLTANAVWAQDVPPKAPITPVVGLDPLRGIINPQNGDYSFYSYDGTYIKAETLKRIFGTREADKEYFLSAVKKMDEGFAAFMQDAVFYSTEIGADDYSYPAYADVDGLVTLRDTAKAKANHYIDAETFLKAIRRFNHGKMRLAAQIEALRSIVGAFPSQQPIIVEGTEVTIPSYGDLKMDEIANFYVGRLDELTTLVKDLRHKIQLPNGNRILTKAGEGLVLTDKAYFNPEELETARAEVQKLQTEKAKERDVANMYTLFAKKTIQEFINDFWDRYRLQQKGIKDIQKEQLEYAVRTFWLRSYLRAQYGVRLGGIGIDYDEKKFNLEVILNSNVSLMKFHKEVAWTDGEVKQSIKNYRNIMYRLQERTGDILPPIEDPAGLGDKAINATWYVGANAAYVITFLAGNRNLAQAMNMVMRLAAADIYEEFVLMDSTGQDRILEMYKQRYRNSPEGIKQVEAWEDAFNNATINRLGVTAGSKEQIELAVTNMLRNRADRWQQAQDQLELVKSFEETNQFLNGVLKGRQSRLRD